MTNDDQTISEVEALLAQLPHFSRPLVRRYFRSGLSVDQKADDSPVTIADRTIEAELRSAIKTAFPAHAIIGEEEGGQADSPVCWVIDPIDGTRAFVIGKPLFGTLVGVAKDGEPFAGLIDMPALDETYLTQNARSYLITGSERTTLATSSCQRLQDAQIATTSPEAFTADGLARFNRLSRLCRSSHYGGDCYNYALLAAGHLDIVMEHQLAAHDFMALIPVLEGAGAIVTDWSGQRPHLSGDGSLLVAATPALHQAALASVSGMVSTSSGPSV